MLEVKKYILCWVLYRVFTSFGPLCLMLKSKYFVYVTFVQKLAKKLRHRKYGKKSCFLLKNKKSTITLCLLLGVSSSIFVIQWQEDTYGLRHEQDLLSQYFYPLGRTENKPADHSPTISKPSGTMWEK